jgi:hypothetical protein
MNDTEDEARRLLAAAAEDVPPGIDLLDGFAVALRRDRARRTRKGALLSAGAAAAAAVGTVVALTIGSAPPALATVTSALTRTLAQSYHLTEREKVYYITNGRIGRPDYDTCTTKADPVRHLQAVSCSYGLEIRQVGGYQYEYYPDPPPDTPVDHPGRPWARTPIADMISLPGAIGAFAFATPGHMLAEIKDGNTVAMVGPASGPGWTGTRYAFSGRPAAGTGEVVRISGTVTVDQQGRVRTLALTILTAAGDSVYVIKQVLTFSEFGAPVTVTTPPADQTFCDAPICTR